MGFIDDLQRLTANLPNGSELLAEPLPERTGSIDHSTAEALRAQIGFVLKNLGELVEECDLRDDPRFEDLLIEAGALRTMMDHV